MILPDINLIVYAYNTSSPKHGQARAWWEKLLSSSVSIHLPWVVILGFVRLMTHPAVFEHPLRPSQAFANVRAWLQCSNVILVHPGPRHLDIAEALLKRAGTAGNLTTDAHLAALAIEHQCELHSNDRDFSRFPGLRWHNPLR